MGLEAWRPSGGAGFRALAIDFERRVPGPVVGTPIGRGNPHATASKQRVEALAPDGNAVGEVQDADDEALPGGGARRKTRPRRIPDSAHHVGGERWRWVQSEYRRAEPAGDIAARHHRRHA